jgi:hypothetical protein
MKNSCRLMQIQRRKTKSQTLWFLLLRARSGTQNVSQAKFLLESQPFDGWHSCSRNPNLYCRSRPEQLNRQIREDLSDQIIPSTQDDLPIAPNFFLAAKGPDGSLAVAGRQALYDSTLGERGQLSLRSWGQDEPVFDNKAHTITSIYHGGQLKMYSIHAAQPNSPSSRPESYIHQTDA